jgi:hypothetical protein
MDEIKLRTIIYIKTILIVKKLSKIYKNIYLTIIFKN